MTDHLEELLEEQEELAREREEAMGWLELPGEIPAGRSRRAARREEAETDGRSEMLPEGERESGGRPAETQDWAAAEQRPLEEGPGKGLTEAEQERESAGPERTAAERAAENGQEINWSPAEHPGWTRTGETAGAWEETEEIRWGAPKQSTGAAWLYRQIRQSAAEAGAIPLGTGRWTAPVQRRDEPAAEFSPQTLDRLLERDARRYDGGFPLY